MNNRDSEPPTNIPWRIRYYDVSDSNLGTQTQDRQKAT